MSMYTYVQRTEERYSKRRMKQEPCVPIEIFNWKKDKFCLSYPDKLEGWEICHYGYDEVMLYIILLLKQITNLQFIAT